MNYIKMEFDDENIFDQSAAVLSSAGYYVFNGDDMISIFEKTRIDGIIIQKCLISTCGGGFNLYSGNGYTAGKQKVSFLTDKNPRKLIQQVKSYINSLRIDYKSMTYISSPYLTYHVEKLTGKWNIPNIKPLEKITIKPNFGGDNLHKANMSETDEDSTAAEDNIDNTTDDDSTDDDSTDDNLDKYVQPTGTINMEEVLKYMEEKEEKEDKKDENNEEDVVVIKAVNYNFLRIGSLNYDMSSLYSRLY